MSDYRRFISYMYLYENGVKTMNAGFVKVESRNGQCRISLSLKNVYTETEHYQAYMFLRFGQELRGIYMGNIKIKNHGSEWNFRTDTGNIAGSGYKLEQMSGMIIKSEGDKFYGTRWDQGDLDIRQFVTQWQENDLPVLGVVEPSCREALAVTKNKKIGMIATLASARSGAYERTLKGLDADVQVVSQPCPLFVPLVENGRFRQGDVVIETVAREYLTPLMEAGVDTLILGCTHYPLLKDIIGEICGPGVTLIDSGAASARALRQQLAAEGQLTDRQQGETRFYVSDRPEDFEKLAAVFLEEPLSRGAERIDIEQY